MNEVDDEAIYPTVCDNGNPGEEGDSNDPNNITMNQEEVLVHTTTLQPNKKRRKRGGSNISRKKRVAR